MSTVVSSVLSQPRNVQPKHLSSKLLEGKFADFSTEHFLISRLPLARSADITFMLALDDLPDLLLVHSFSSCRIIAGASPVQPTTPTAICRQHELSEQASPISGCAIIHGSPSCACAHVRAAKCMSRCRWRRVFIQGETASGQV